jgi:phenylpropionate dioxygenase-like ring-hydroxylating dioxygenase large terminal subunit
MADGESKTGVRQEAAFGRGFLHDLWYFAALSREVRPGALRRQDILGEPVLIGRTRSGKAFALRDVCPHRAAPLSAGRMVAFGSEGEAVECPYHGWRFRAADGVCSSVPSLLADQDLEVERIRVRAYPVHEDQGLIYIYVASDPRADDAPAPPVRFDGVVGGAPKIVDRMAFDTHIDQAVVGLMDPTHGPYVHQQWWWRSKSRQIEKAKRFEPRPLGFAMVRHAPSKNSRAYRILGGAPETEITFRLPGYRWEHIQVGRRQVLALTCLTPLTATRTQITQIIWSDHPAFILLRPLIAAGARRFLRQDGDMVNLQNEGLRYDPPLLWIDDADRQAKWYQALKREWMKSRAEVRPFVNPVEPTTLRWRS